MYVKKQTAKINPTKIFSLTIHKYNTCNSCNMGTSVLPDMCPSTRMHISGRTLVHMLHNLQVLYTTLIVRGQTSAWIRGAKVVHLYI